jgi:hypothetical protein
VLIVLQYLYRVFYCIEDDCLTILRVLRVHSRDRWSRQGSQPGRAETASAGSGEPSELEPGRAQREGAMTEQEIAVILHRLDKLQPAKDTPMEERIRLLLQRRAVRQEINGRRIRGTVEELLREVNELYASGVPQDRIKKCARVIRSQLLWAAIERKRAAMRRAPGKTIK